MRTLLMGMVLLGSLASCADSDVQLRQRGDTTTSSPATTAESRVPAERDAPPSVTLLYGDERAELRPFTSCYGRLCADGSPEYELDVGEQRQLFVEFPLDGWDFEAVFRPAGEECGRRQVAPLQREGERRWRLEPAGPIGRYDMILSGRGPGGDVHVSFRWTTTRKGPSPQPEARLALLADHDGRVDSYGVELEIQQLRTTPADAQAIVTVTSSEGRSLTFDASRSTESCRPTGTVYWDGPDERGKAAAALGSAPFRLEVAVTLDGSRHTAKATWPDDVIKGNEPSVRLVFDPPLRGPD